MGNILSVTVGVDPVYTIPAIALVVGFYLFMGGYNSVIKTDYIQFFIVLCIAAIPFLTPVKTEYLMDFSSLFSLGTEANIAFLILGIVLPFTAADLWQRIFSAKDDNVARWATPIGGILAIALSFGLFWMGLASRDLLPDLQDPNTMFYDFFQLDIMAPAVKAFIIVILFAMGMSTLDTHSYLFTSTIMRDFVRTSVRNDRVLYIRYSRLIMVAMLIAMTLMSLYFTNVVEVIMGLVSIYSLAFPVLLPAAAGWLAPSRMLDIGFAIIQGIGIALFLYMFNAGYFDLGFINSAIPVALTTGLSLIWWGIVWVAQNRKMTAPQRPV